ncbi:hypothetical protein [Paenibacillus sp. P13VS]|uniref:hypothetical protein n=1 Tax=Paenibacillus sp. P13VS TaxID=2697367 RepID=UPI001D1169DD|nr:hypothetical protein [Paenibacillus sp. P13VS]
MVRHRMSQQYVLDQTNPKKETLAQAGYDNFPAWYERLHQIALQRYDPGEYG